MRGAMTPAQGDPKPMSFTLTVASDDLDAMSHDQNHVATMIGTVTCEALSAQPLSVTDGQFNLFIKDPAVIDQRLMVYRMVLHSVEGPVFYFHGVKTITDTSALHAWAQTTTLAVTVTFVDEPRAALTHRWTQAKRSRVCGTRGFA
jgi:cholesterol oxidase